MKAKILWVSASILLSIGIIYLLFSTSKNTLFRLDTAALPTDPSQLPTKFAAKDGLANTDYSLGENVAALQQDVALLKVQLAQLRADLTAYSVKPAVLAGTKERPLLDPSKEAQRIAELRASEEKQQEKQGQLLETGFQKQTVNPTWSTKTKKLILEALAADDVATGDIVDIDCRATMCRVELTNDADHPAPKISSFPMIIGQDMPNIRVNQLSEQDGSTTTVLYLSQEDFATLDNGS